MSKIRIGVFGAARGGTMIDVLLAHPDAEVVAVCDKYKPLLKSTKERAEKQGVTNVAFFEDFEEFFQFDMDAVILANYANEHAPYAVRFLRSGRHVMSECLTCASMAQAVELIEAVEESGKVYTYAENYSYAYDTFEMRKLFRSGDFGELVYAEGEYVHDCTGWWPHLAYGDPTHWRNNGYSTFYCTHGIAPIMTVTGLRPVSVTGFETPISDYMIGRGTKSATAGMEILTMENGAIVRCLNGDLRHHSPHEINSAYRFFGTKGEMKNSRSIPNQLSVYKLGEDEVSYVPEPQFEADFVRKFSTHGGADFFPTHLFIESILGNPVGREYAIDVYSAVDMCICGILAYRSILNGNKPVTIPNLRNKEERDAYRNDHACTWEYEAGDQLLPHTSKGNPVIPASVYEKQLREWLDCQES